MTLLLVLCCLLLHRTSGAENDTGEDIDLGPLHIIKDSNYLMDRHSPYPIDMSSDDMNCRRPAKCISLNKTTCMGMKLPYTHTTLDLIPGHITQSIIEVDKIIIYVLFALITFPCRFF